jgi:hypothetical protein
MFLAGVRIDEKIKKFFCIEDNMKVFGFTPTSPEIDKVSVPSGNCDYCHEPFVPADKGVVLPYLSNLVNEDGDLSKQYHRTCFMEIIGIGD